MAGIEDLLGQLTGGSGSGGAGGMDLSKLTALLAPIMQQLQSSGGLNAILGKLQSAGLTDQVNSWLGQGSNAPVDPNQIGEALGGEVDAMAASTGLSPDDVKTGLSDLLPGLVDKLSPGGSLPTSPEDITGMLSQLPGGDQLGSILGGLLGGNK